MTQAPSVEADASRGLISKAVGVLGALSAHSVLSTAEIAEATGEPLSSVYRLLPMLTKLGWIEKAEARSQYRLGAVWLRQGSRLSRSLDLRKQALPVLEELRDETGATAFLCVRRGDLAVCIERAEGLEVQSLALAIGGSLPLHRGAAPQVLLASGSDEEVDGYFAGIEPGSWSGADRERVRQVSTSGFSISDGDVTVGVGAYGAPVRDHEGTVVAAISVSGLRERLFDPGRDVLALLRRSALEISRSLGYEVDND